MVLLGLKILDGEDVLDRIIGEILFPNGKADMAIYEGLLSRGFGVRSLGNELLSEIRVIDVVEDHGIAVLESDSLHDVQSFSGWIKIVDHILGHRSR